MSNERFNLGYCPELDGLRGVAILWVMFHHAKAPFMKGGFIGVDVFFVLSGFLITSLLIQEFDGSGTIDLKNFYIRRVLRLGPALIAMLTVFCIASFAVLNVEKANSNYVDSLISFFYFANWAKAFSIHPPDFIGHTWSLSIEEQFYILWPILLLTQLRLFKKRLHIVIFAVAIALISCMVRVYLIMNGASPLRLYFGLDTRADVLMIGCVLGIIFSSGMVNENARAKLQKPLVIMAPLSVACLLAFSIFAHWRDPGMYKSGFIIIELMAAVLVVDMLVNQRSIIRRLLSIGWLVWVGKISYGLYLWHYPIFRTMQANNMRGLTVITGGTLITFIIASLSYYRMERPLLKLKKRFTREAPSPDASMG